MSDGFSGDSVVEAISNQGWLQGDLVAGEALSSFIPEKVLSEQLEGKLPTFWILASHSCTVHARNYEDAPSVEWVACKLVKKKAYGKCLNASNPRKLHLPIAEKLHLELRIQRRIWTPRSVLPTLERERELNLDPLSKETFGYWLGHSYTRLAMPDSLVERLRIQSADGPIGLGVQIEQFISERGDLLHSAWVSYEPKIELPDPSEPYFISFRFLIKPQYRRNIDEAQHYLNALIDAAPALPAGLVFDDAVVAPLQDFTMLDAETYTRYNTYDWLSLGEDADELQEESE
ncbi:hypothetical protein [Pseudomonas brassicacearum]|uniref:hypothetical protein n=1 Tax=Pseudomonas brassicacearum TaxID=930166 RepID=UPI00067D89A3|nr:hypothetical protein [Pseudomonas brassicacearum]